jgi:hypothetical protein
MDESFIDARTKGHLQNRAHMSADTGHVHWGGDAAGWMRGVKVSKIGFKVMSEDILASQDPSNMRSILQFKGKDNYAANKEYLAPFFPTLDSIAADGLTIGKTHYTIRQTLGGDYVFLAEVAGHSGHSHSNGCFLCEVFHHNHGLVVENAEGKRVPVMSKLRSLEDLCNAAHRPMTTGPGR